MPPAATFCHSAAERAVGPAANGRKPAGFTPSTLTKTPLTLIRPASTGTAATTPLTCRSLLTRPAGKDV